MKKYVKSLVALLLGCLLTSLLVIPVQASETALDVNENCSITVSLRDPGTDNPIKGIRLTLYKVGEVEGSDSDGYSVVICNELEDKIPLDDVYSLLTENYAKALEAYITANGDNEGIVGTSLITASNGVVVFDNLEVGLYLVVQTGGKESYAMNSFLVMVPVIQEENLHCDYNVIARPKVVRNNNPNNPNNQNNSGDPNDSFSANNPQDTTKLQETYNLQTDSMLPQTGQLWWPVTVMSVAGLLCCGAGYWLRRSSNCSAHRE